MDLLVRRFKEAAVSFGLLPAKPDAALAMTQLPAEEVSKDSQPTTRSLAEVHDQLRATRTFARHAPKDGTSTVWQNEHDALVINAEQALLHATLVKQQKQRRQRQSVTTVRSTVPTEIASHNTTHDEEDVKPPASTGIAIAAVPSDRHTEHEDDEEEFFTAPQEPVAPVEEDKDTAVSVINNEHEDIQNDEKSEEVVEKGLNTTDDMGRPDELDSHRAMRVKTTYQDESLKVADEEKEGENTVMIHTNDSRKMESAEMDTKRSMEIETEPVTAVPASNKVTTTEKGPTTPLSRSGLPAAADITIAAASSSPLRTPQVIHQRHLFAVGDVVQVQPRTWPGVNLPGGVGRIKAVHHTTQHHLFYDIDYVLGGRERKVDAIFCSVTDLPRTGRRKSEGGVGGVGVGVASRRLEQKQQQGVIPPTLLAKLKSEGFDVEGKIEPETIAAKTSVPTTTAETTTTSRRSKSHDKKETKAPKLAAALVNRKRKTTEIVEKSAKPKKRRMGESILSHVASLGRKKAAAVAPVPIKLTDSQACQIAEQKYQERFQKAIQKSSVSLAVSSLSGVDMTRVERLCKQTKNIRVKLSNHISKQTTLCIIPSDESDPTMARARTAKAMRAALLGIPLVTPTWVESCLSKGNLSTPTAVHYLKGLPTKSGEKAGGPCGVAHLAARSIGLLQNYQVHLCLPSKMQADVVQVVKDAGGTITARLLPSKNGQTLLVLCGDTDHNVGGVCRE